MYLDLFDKLELNKSLIRIAGFEVAAYCAELQSVLKQVVKKHTADEFGFFTLDRDYIERETTLTTTKQLKCDEKLALLGVLAKDSANPNRIAISMDNLVCLITGEDTKKLKKNVKTSADARAAKIAGIKFNLKRTLTAGDSEVRSALETWIESMVDAANCKFTKAVVQLFEKTVLSYTTDKNTQLKIIEIATINSYRDASWAINRLSSNSNNYYKAANTLSPQKTYSGVSDTVSF